MALTPPDALPCAGPGGRLGEAAQRARLRGIKRATEPPSKEERTWRMHARAAALRDGRRKPMLPLPHCSGARRTGVCVSAPPVWGPRSCADRQEVSIPYLVGALTNSEGSEGGVRSQKRIGLVVNDLPSVESKSPAKEAGDSVRALHPGARFSQRNGHPA